MAVIKAKQKVFIASITLATNNSINQYNSNLNRVTRAKRAKVAISVLHLIGGKNSFALIGLSISNTGFLLTNRTKTQTNTNLNNTVRAIFN